MIRAEELSLEYHVSGKCIPALSALSFHIHEGELAFVLGASGSGKTSLALTLSTLRPFHGGKLSIGGKEAGQPETDREIRRMCGLIFDKPEEQFVATNVEEEVAFGAWNYLKDPALVASCTERALSTVKLQTYRNRVPQLLTNGEKYRLALAGVLVYEPELLLLDGLPDVEEPKERSFVLSLLQELHRQGKTIVVFTHDTQAAAIADKVILLKEGKLLAQGTAREMIGNRQLLMESNLSVPLSVRIYCDMMEAGIPMTRCPLDLDELVEEICR